MKKLFTLMLLSVFALPIFAQTSVDCDEAYLDSVYWELQGLQDAEPSRGITNFSAVDENICWLHTLDGSKTDGTNTILVEVFKTVDGGENWIMTETAPVVKSGYGIGNICALDENIAYVTVFAGGKSQDNTTGVYKTADGGSSWEQLTTRLPESFCNNVYFWNENEGMCLGDQKGGWIELYYTTNGGNGNENWIRVPKEDISGNPNSTEEGLTGGVSVYGDLVAFYTSDERVYISEDRGKTWRIANSGKDIFNGKLAESGCSIAFSSYKDGILIRSKGDESTGTMQTNVAFTRDGGETWTENPTDYLYTSGIVPVDSNYYFSVGGFLPTVDGRTNIAFAGISYGSIRQDIVTQKYAPKFSNVTGGLSIAKEIDRVEYDNSMEDEEKQLVFEVEDYYVLPINFHNEGLLQTASIWNFQYTAAIWANRNYGWAGGFSYYKEGNDVVMGSILKHTPHVVSKNKKAVDYKEINNVKFYPNPAKDVLYLTSEDLIKNVEIYDLTGRLVKTVNGFDNQSQIDLNNLVSGLYVVKTATNKGVVSSKVNVVK